MLVLAIESATAEVGCAVVGHEGVLAAVSSGRSRRHAENLTPAIEFACRQAEVGLDDLGAIAVDVGPGLFTGLRVGVTTAKTMAQALRIPVIPATSLDLLAFPARLTHRTILSAVDARRGEVFHATYRSVPGGVQQVHEPMLSTPDDLVADLLARRDEVLAVGDGACRYAAELREVPHLEVGGPEHEHPSAATLGLLAHAQALREEWSQPWDVHPLYLRGPDAVAGWTSRGSAP